MTAAYGLPYVVEKISDVLVARLAMASITLADPDGIAYGRARLAETPAPPRVVVVPKGGAFGGRDGAYPTNVPAAKVRRPRMSRRAEGEVHCWGRSYEEAEILLDQFCNAALDVAVGQLEFTGAQWSEEQRVVQAGEEVIFGFTVIIPIVDGPVPTQVVAAAQDEGHFITQGGGDTIAC